jgi:hypothetical protein
VSFGSLESKCIAKEVCCASLAGALASSILESTIDALHLSRVRCLGVVSLGSLSVSALVSL